MEIEMRRRDEDSKKAEVIDMWDEILRGAMPGAPGQQQPPAIEADERAAAEGSEPDVTERDSESECMWGCRLLAAAHARLAKGAQGARARAVR